MTTRLRAGLPTHIGEIFRLKQQLHEEKFRGCIEFPGGEKVAAERITSSAVFEVGDRVAVWYSDERKGKPATVVSPYGAYLVRADDGLYLHNKERVEYCQGYRARHDDGEVFFYYAWQLSPIGHSYGHLKLVK